MKKNGEKMEKKWRKMEKNGGKWPRDELRREQVTWLGRLNGG